MAKYRSRATGYRSKAYPLPGLTDEQVLSGEVLMIPWPIPLPGGGELDFYLTISSDACSVDVDAMTDVAAKATADIAQQTIQENMSHGRDAHGNPLPPISEFTEKARRRRHGRLTKRGREQRAAGKDNPRAHKVIDYTTPCYETGMTMRLVRVRKRKPGSYYIESWIMGGADKKYGAGNLVDYPAGEEAKVKAALEDAVDKAIH